MFSGIDEVDWASMEHAYGPADDVPELLRGLASDDPAEREAALDGMYGAVHHQGDVYACTLACIPFLFELAVDPGVQDRGSVVELLTSIGGFDLDEDDEAEIDEDEIEGAANYAMAAAAVTAGAGVFFELIADEDPGVRLAAPLALATLHRHPVRVLALLRERLPVEPDEEVRLALVEAAGRVALRHRPLAGRVGEWLGRLASRA
ncbi:PBS lyase, partial [Streptomyces anulatus]|nr:PBS lyase [Streptomyces anulatus]